MARSPDHLLILDIDGLRPDVFTRALAGGRLPHCARLLGGRQRRRGLLLPVLAPAPSITFTSQACLFTGAHPKTHGVVGNQFFDRFGRHSEGLARHYAFDVGDMLAADDAVRVFTDGLASNCLDTPTLYEQLAAYGWSDSVVVSHMYARGARAWLRPSVIDLARFTKGGSLFGLSAAEYDRRTLERALDYLASYPLPQVLTVYFMGVDHQSHHDGPKAQENYLVDVLDGLIGELWAAVRAAASGRAAPFTLFCSDHGQIGVPADDTHSLRLAFPFERELGPLFDALKLDVYDFPGEDPNVDAVVASNGGLAHVYLRNRQSGRWVEPPSFGRDVLPVGRAFWEAHATGRYAAELRGALAGVLAHDVEGEGWSAGYQALTPSGERLPLEKWFAGQPAWLYADPVHRLENLAGPASGDLLLISNYPAGYYFGAPMSGVHGGLHPEDSGALLACGWPAATGEDWRAARRAFRDAITRRCALEGGRQPSTTDMVTGIQAVLDVSRPGQDP